MTVDPADETVVATKAVERLADRTEDLGIDDLLVEDDPPLVPDGNSNGTIFKNL